MLLIGINILSMKRSKYFCISLEYLPKVHGQNKVVYMLLTSYLLNKKFKLLNFTYIVNYVEVDGYICCLILLNFKKSIKNCFVEELRLSDPEINHMVCSPLTLEEEKEWFGYFLSECTVYPTVTNCSKISLILDRLKKNKIVTN